MRRLLGARLPALDWLGLPKPLLPNLAELIGPNAPFAGFGAGEIQALESRFSAANERFALDYGIDPAGTLFRDAGCGAGPRPNIAHWEAFDAEERRRIRRHVLGRLASTSTEARAMCSCGACCRGASWFRGAYAGSGGVTAEQA